jgi:hypothetical protein
MGVSPISALVSLSCATTMDPMVVCTWVHSDSQQLKPFCSFLGLFAQDVQIRSSAHRVLPAALILLELMLQKELLPSDLHNELEGRLPSKYFLRAADPLDCFDPLTTTQMNFIKSFILTRLPSSAKLELSLFSFCLPFFL